MWCKIPTLLLENLPSPYEGIPDIEELTKTMSISVDEFKQATADMIDDVYVATASETGIERYEKLWGIIPPARDDLETRRRKIMAMFRDKPPINDVTVLKIAESYLGVPVDMVKFDDRRYYIELKYRNNKELVDAQPLKERLRDVIPCNIAFEVKYAYIMWGEVKNSTWGDVKTGTWDKLMLGA